MVPLTEGLLYPGESDEPVHFFCKDYPDSSGSFGPEQFRQLFGIDQNISILTRDPFHFWTAVTTHHSWYDDSARERVERFITIREILDSTLENIKYFEVGNREVSLYYLGFHNQCIHGLQTMVVRT